jgi:hypothetical protein
MGSPFQQAWTMKQSFSLCENGEKRQIKNAQSEPEGNVGTEKVILGIIDT